MVNFKKNMKKEMKIFIDFIDNNTIQGWFINLAEPENNRILLFLDGHYKSVTVANIERQDVSDAHGKLESGFSFDISKFSVFQKVEIRSDTKKVLLSLEGVQQEKELPRDSGASGISPYTQERHEQIEKICIDLSRPVNGDNWYDIEPMGRWGGPELESTLKIPALGKGKYQLQLNIDSAFCDLQAMKVRFNSKLVKFSNTQYDTPVLLQAEVVVKKDDPFWHISFKYPKTCLPEGESGADQRRLGVFLKEVSLSKLTSPNSK